MEKTAMQIIKSNHEQMEYAHFEAWLKENINVLLEKERKQICDAWTHGTESEAGEHRIYTGEQYYNSTFNNI